MAAEIRFLALLLLPALFTASFADIIDVEEDGIYTRRTSNISSIVDSLLPTIREYLLDEHMDPMKLNDITEQLPGVIIKNRYLYLNGGLLRGLSGLNRKGDILVISDSDTHTLDATFGFDQLSATYNYLLKDFLIARRGQLDALFSNLQIRVVAGFNANTRKVVLYSINILKFDNMKITLRGHVIDPILNAVIRRFTNRFSKLIITKIETEAKVIAQKYLNQLAGKIPFSNKYLIDNDILESAPTSFNFLLI